jgi:hypothetical protein
VINTTRSRNLCQSPASHGTQARRVTAPQKAANAAKSKSRKARREEFDDTPEGVAARIEAEIEAEEQERVAKRRASGHRWAPFIEPLFWLAMLFTALMLCSARKLPQGVIGLSAVSAALSFVAAYAIHRASAVVQRFPVRWFGRRGTVTGTLFCIGVGLLCVVVLGFAIREQFFA